MILISIPSPPPSSPPSRAAENIEARNGVA